MAAMKTFSVSGAVTDGVSGITNIIGSMTAGMSENSGDLIKAVPKMVMAGMTKQVVDFSNWGWQVVKKCHNLTFKVNFLCQKSFESFSFFH